MLNGEAKKVDRERLNRVANATGQSVAAIHASLERRENKVQNPGPIKEWRPNSGQHYPEFGQKEIKKIEIGTVQIPKPKRVIHGKRLSDEAFKAEIDAQRKRAQALAYLAQTEDSVSEDYLRGEAAQQHEREKRSRVERTKDNTLALLAEQELHSKLDSIQSKIRQMKKKDDNVTPASILAGYSTASSSSEHSPLKTSSAIKCQVTDDGPVLHGPVPNPQKKASLAGCQQRHVFIPRQARRR
mmetsp:Transcript_1023/g.1275  ORF Transcript_1023/g.1275 Transcript_1023/m.1275 type:complete len:242 (+) Transcript_1023:184-909(+)|eukprot:CAMPEP_0197291590 /NCGR_PEP_ID=MMETSP0890-20130614/17270_1 /TAXON_ID=44058 ORGANISM="Aureoumbra lagunensis, Strain CCMP1510" /NCGR_SAMPLE_ID=MMETSP0890 /ASSEMBLY_ACC=CAM_ASM_000533 /LENGTH=241 /DNA_ID=CAMNT_0042764777 /DNA_START=106 /DNA_END=831 /DNA_ORIENTATION=-